MDVRVLAVMAGVLIAVSRIGCAAVNDWSAIGPSGGTVNNIVYGRSGGQALMVAAGGFYRSQNSGVTWQLIKADFLNAPTDVAIDPSDPTRIYVVSVNAPCLYVSTDGGLTLAASTTLPMSVTQAQRIAVSGDGASIYLSNAGRIFFSSDRGQTWLERTALSADPLTSVLKLVADPVDPKTLYAATATATTQTEGMFATHDGAVTWQQLTSGTESASLTSDIAINQVNPMQIWTAQYDGVWVSADRGIHWSNVLSAAMTSIAIDPTNPAILYAGSPYGKVYRTANAGTNWTDISGNILAGENVHLAINPALPTQLLAGGYAGVSGSTNSGSVWASQQTGFNATNVSGFSADLSADRIYIDVPANGVFYEAAGAALTLPVNNAALQNLSTLATIDVTSILALPGSLFASLFNGLTTSVDGGTTWGADVKVLPPPDPQQIFLMTNSPGAPRIILAASSGPVVKSQDNGVTWTQVSTGTPANSTASNLLFAPSDPSIAYGAFYVSVGPSLLGLYKSTDAGDDWAPVNNHPGTSATALLAVDPGDANILYGLGSSLDSSLLKSLDGGNTWTALTWNPAQPSSAPTVLSVNPKNPSILYAAGVDRIARSVDGGSSWETLRDSRLPLWSPNALIADPLRPENLLVGTLVAGVQQMTIAPDLAVGVAGPSTPLAVGSVAAYTYTVTNLGPFDATGANITVQFPSTAQNVTASTAGGTCSVSGGATSCIFPILRKGTNVSLTVTSTASAAGAFPLSAVVAADQPDSDPTNNSVASSAMVEVIADLSVTATGDAAVHVGDVVNYTLVATNNGPNLAPAAQLTFNLATGMTPGAVASTDAVCTGAASGQFTCNLNDLGVSHSVTVTVAATAAAVGTLSSTVSATSSAADLVSTNNSATVITTVAAVPPPVPAPIPSPSPTPSPSPSGGHGGGGGLTLVDLLALASLGMVRKHTSCVQRRPALRV